jgi:hypothetical protein
MSQSEFLLLNDLLNARPRFTFGLGINNDFHFPIKSGISLLCPPRRRPILAKQDLDFFDSFSTSLKPVSRIRSHELG